MKLVVLSDAKAMDGYGSEHGLSFLLEVDNQRTLFDTGASDVFLKNARVLGEDLNGLDRIVLSHGHWDHGNGLQYLDNLPLVCHPGCFVRRYRKSGRENLGLALSKTKIEAKFDLRTSREARKLSENLYFLGEIPRVNDFEARSTKYQLEDGADDFIRDDSGLACMTEKGLVVLSGCAHSGICNMIEHARNVTGLRKVEAVLGGFHLSYLNEQARKTIRFLRENGVNSAFPSHCTQEPVLAEFQTHFKSPELLVGNTLYF